MGTEGTDEVMPLVNACVVALTLLGAWTAMPQPACSVEITAHRGASHDAPENTLASAQLAWRRGADSVEVDVHLSKDDCIVVIHDAKTKRTSGVEGEVAELTLAELRKLDVGAWKNTAFAGQRIPTLSEVLRTVPEGRRLLIEIKCGRRIVPLLRECLAASGLPPSATVVIGFDYDVMAEAKRVMPERTVLWLLKATPTRDEKTGAVAVTVAERIRQCRRAKLDGLSVSCKSEIDRRFVDQVHQAGLQLHVWTVDDPQLARHLASWGVDAITTNRPAWLRAQIAGPPGADYQRASTAQ